MKVSMSLIYDKRTLAAEILALQRELSPTTRGSALVHYPRPGTSSN